MVRPGPRPSRRSFLATAAVTSTAFVAGTGRTFVVDGEPKSKRSAELSRGATPDEEPFSEETIERARSVGKKIRESVVAAMRDGDIFATEWYFGDADLVTSAGHAFRFEDPAEEPTFDAWLADGRSLELTLLDSGWSGGSRETDVAALRASVPGDPLPPGDPGDLTEGQPLVTVGHPGDVGYWVISLGRYRGEVDHWSDSFSGSVPAVGGTSGSPTVTLDGEVVGMHVAIGGSDIEGYRSAPEAVYGPGEVTEPSRHIRIDVVEEFLAEWSG